MITGLILILGLVLRLISLNQSLWLDEAINVLAFQDNSLWQLITQYTKFDFHPPGYFILMWFWVHIFNNYSENFVRLPSVFFGVAIIYLTYLIGKELVSKKLGLLSAILVAVNPLLIYYSQEARMYSAAAFGVIFNFLFFLKIIKNKKKFEIYYLLTLPLVFLFDYLTYPVILSHFFVILFFNKKLFKKWLVLILPTLILLGIWGIVFYGQLNIGLATATNVKGWSEVVGGADIKNLFLVPIKFTIGRISYPNKYIYAAIVGPILFLCGFLIFWGWGKIKNDLKIKISIIFLIPIITPFLISLFIPVFSYFRLLFLVPFYCLVLAFGILNLKKWWVYLTALLLIFITSSLLYLFNSKFQREDWKGLIAYNQIDKIISSNGNFAPLEYYRRFPKLIPNIRKDDHFPFFIFPGLKNFPASSESDLWDDFNQTIPQFDRIDYIEYLADISDPKRLVQKRIESLGYKLIGKKDFTGVGFLYEYQK